MRKASSHSYSSLYSLPFTLLPSAPSSIPFSSLIFLPPSSVTRSSLSLFFRCGEITPSVHCSHHHASHLPPLHPVQQPGFNSNLSFFCTIHQLYLLSLFFRWKETALVYPSTALSPFPSTSIPAFLSLPPYAEILSLSLVKVEKSSSFPLALWTPTHLAPTLPSSSLPFLSLISLHLHAASSPSLQSLGFAIYSSASTTSSSNSSLSHAPFIHSSQYPALYFLFLR